MELAFWAKGQITDIRVVARLYGSPDKRRLHFGYIKAVITALVESRPPRDERKEQEPKVGLGCSLAPCLRGRPARKVWPMLRSDGSPELLKSDAVLRYHRT